ncbi:MAG: general secretion pathway protein GspB [Desulfobacterales bacterium]
MSTILKALKRVDQSDPPPDDPQSWPPRVDTKKAVRGRLYRIGMHRKVFIAMILVVIVIAAGWLVSSQKEGVISKTGPHSGSEKPAVFRAKIEPPSRESKRPVRQQAVSENRQETRSRVKPDSDSVRKGGLPATSPRSPLRQKNTTDRLTRSTPQVQTAETQRSPKSSISRRPEAKATGSEQRKARPPKSASTRRSRATAAQAAQSYQRLDNAKLKLQAIAWSSVAAQRIAVINNRIVREGESVEGFSINQIRQEDVIVNDGNQSWQLEFELR